MRIIETEVFEFDELSDEAKEMAITGFREDEYFWGEDDRKTLEEFEKIFPVKVGRWEYGYCHSYINFEMDTWVDNDVLSFTGVRLLKYLVNHYWHNLFKGKFICGDKYPKFRHSKVIFDNSCVLTGCCLDMDILNPIYEFLKKPDEHTTLEELMRDCLQSWLSACDNEVEYQNSDEAIIERIEANSYEFTKDGKLI